MKRTVGRESGDLDCTRRSSVAPVLRLGLTLVEMLVVIAIIGLLIQLILPAVQSSREASRRIQCVNNLKQVDLAIHNYHDAMTFLPPGGLWGSGETTWPVRILPFIEETNAARHWDKVIDLKSAYYRASDQARKIQPSIYLCPSRRSAADGYFSTTEALNYRSPWGGGPGALGDYAACFGDMIPIMVDPEAPTKPPLPWATGAFVYPRHMGSITFEGDRAVWHHEMNFSKITDGVSNTIFVGEKFVRPDRFGAFDDGDTSIYSDDGGHTHSRIAGGAFGLLEPDANVKAGDDHSWHYGSVHPGICLFAMGDGRVIAVGVDVDRGVLSHMANRSDGQTFELPQ